MGELEHAFKFNDAVLRHLTVQKKKADTRSFEHDEGGRARRGPASWLRPSSAKAVSPARTANSAPEA